MRSLRRSLRGSGPGVSFFAFQDVITAVIGIIVIITLVLALGTNALIPTIIPSPADLDRQEKLDQLLAQIAKLKNSLLDESADVSEIALRSEINALEARRLALSNRAVAEANPAANDNAAVSQLATLAAVASDSLVEAQVANEAAQSKLAELTRNMNELEAAVAAAEQSLAAELNANKIRLIPDTTDTTKEPILVTVARNELVLQRFDSAETTSITGRTERLVELAEAVSQFRPEDQYFVFFFKPSGFEDFESVLEVARKERFDVGYDVLPEDTSLLLNTQ